MSALMHEMLKSSYPLLKEQLVQKVLEAVKAEKIFLLGAALWRRRTESIFTPGQPSAQWLSDFCLLVLVNEPGKPLHDIQDHIEQRCKKSFNATAIVLLSSTFNEWLAQGHRFACTVYNTTVMIYDGDETPLPLPGKLKEETKESGKLYNETIIRVNEFLAGAELFCVRNQNKMAAFMLHQSAEQCLRTLLKLTTGFHCNTHNIERLAKYASMLYPCINDILPQQTPQDKHLFHLLQKAYIDSRYKDDYTIHQNDLIILTERIISLKDLLHNTWIVFFGKFND
jgi:HEPN domain-containing protein